MNPAEQASASQATLPILCNVPGGLPEPALGSVPLITPNRFFLHKQARVLFELMQMFSIHSILQQEVPLLHYARATSLGLL